MGIASKSSWWPGWLECYLAGLSVTAVVAGYRHGYDSEYCYWWREQGLVVVF